jgi:hypothetical protein
LMKPPGPLRRLLELAGVKDMCAVVDRVPSAMSRLDPVGRAT